MVEATAKAGKVATSPSPVASNTTIQEDQVGLDWEGWSKTSCRGCRGIVVQDLSAWLYQAPTPLH